MSSCRCVFFAAAGPPGGWGSSLLLLQPCPHSVLPHIGCRRTQVVVNFVTLCERSAVKVVRGKRVSCVLLIVSLYRVELTAVSVALSTLDLLSTRYLLLIKGNAATSLPCACAALPKGALVSLYHGV